MAGSASTAGGDTRRRASRAVLFRVAHANALIAGFAYVVAVPIVAARGGVNGLELNLALDAAVSR